jgi:hypothetical protein
MNNVKNNLLRNFMIHTLKAFLHNTSKRPICSCKKPLQSSLETEVIKWFGDKEAETLQSLHYHLVNGRAGLKSLFSFCNTFQLPVE